MSRRFRGWDEFALKNLGEKQKKRKKNKFNAEQTIYGGKRFDSKYESQVAQELDWMLQGGEIQSYETQVKIPLIVNGKLITNHYMDFVVTHNDGTKEYVEAKGHENAVWKLKRNLFLALNPGVKYTIRKKGNEV